MATKPRNHDTVRLRDECSTGTKVHSWIVRQSLKLGNACFPDRVLTYA